VSAGAGVVVERDRRARDLLARAIRTLSGAGVQSARQDAERLLADCLGIERLALYLDAPAIPADAARRYDAALRRRAAHEPLQYVLGWEEFRGLRIQVSPAVLIPRQETELLVDWALELTPAGGTVCDLGTGSGCIACSIATARNDVNVIAVDRSAGALEVAAENVHALGLGARVELELGDLWQPLARRARVDVVVANPPYIRSGWVGALPVEVREWEPLEALDGGEDGMTLHRRIVEGAAERIRPGGALVMEVGDDQATAIQGWMRAAGFAAVSARRDLIGVERYVAGRLPDPGREGR
jgi:release factor glutamine methyltransferase